MMVSQCLRSRAFNAIINFLFIFFFKTMTNRQIKKIIFYIFYEFLQITHVCCYLFQRSTNHIYALSRTSIKILHIYMICITLQSFIKIMYIKKYKIKYAYIYKDITFLKQYHLYIFLHILTSEKFDYIYNQFALQILLFKVHYL